jgi:hypothetical protein
MLIKYVFDDTRGCELTIIPVDNSENVVITMESEEDIISLKINLQKFKEIVNKL